MALRLSSLAPSAAAAAAVAPQSHIDAFLASDATLEQKVDCLKLLNTVLKNLNDPVKAIDPKYRQLKLDNAKVQSNLIRFPSAVSFLESIGFARRAAAMDAFRMDEVPNASLVSDALQIVRIALDRLVESSSNAAREQQQQHRALSSSSSEQRLSEKQKARRLLEREEQRQRELAKEHRKRNVAMIQQDKFVRENDENWTSRPSAACAKTGSSISTFRDKYGEQG